MKKKLWLTQLPFVLFFSFCFLVTELGVHGQLGNPFLRESIYPALSRVTNSFTDLKFHFRGPQTPKNKIVVVEVDSPSIERFGRWPWHRDLTAYLIEKTFEAGAKVIGLDMVFSEPDQRLSPELADFLRVKGLEEMAQKFETDPQLQDVIRRHSDHLVMGWTTDTACQPLYEEAQFCPVMNPDAIASFPEDFERFAVNSFVSPVAFDPSKTPMISFVTPITNIPLYHSVAKHSGFFNAILDSDGHIRRSSLIAIAKGKAFPSLPLEMAKIGLNEKVRVELDERQRVTKIQFENSKRSIPVTPLSAMLVNFRGPSSIFTHVSAEDVMVDKEMVETIVNQKPVTLKKSELLKDAYVLIGVSAVGVFDMRQFPFEANSAGVYGHANILDNLLSGDPLLAESSGKGMLWILLVMVLGVIGFAIAIERLDAVPALVLFLVVFSLTIYTDIYVLFRKNYSWNTAFIYLELSAVFVFTLAAKYVIEERNKKFIRSAFSKYVAPVVVDSILKDPTKLSLGGERRELTILFSDIRGFTTFSEKMDAKALASFLNDYLGIMTHLVFANQGTLDKYIGDAVMAFWGAPLDQPNHASNSCKAAVQMMNALYKNYERFKSQYGIEVHVGIGINSGVVSVGNMGSEQNFEYTVIGDHVNLASRLEGLTKKYGASILTTRHTFDCIEASGESFMPHRILDHVKVKGKKKAVEIIQVLDQEYPTKALELFSEARTLYEAQKWQEAIDKFTLANELILEVHGKSDGPCEVFLERCRQFQGEPPSPDWDGSWEMDSK